MLKPVQQLYYISCSKIISQFKFMFGVSCVVQVRYCPQNVSPRIKRPSARVLVYDYPAAVANLCLGSRIIPGRHKRSFITLNLAPKQKATRRSTLHHTAETPAIDPCAMSLKIPALERGRKTRKPLRYHALCGQPFRIPLAGKYIIEKWNLCKRITYIATSNKIFTLLNTYPRSSNNAKKFFLRPASIFLNFPYNLFVIF